MAGEEQLHSDDSQPVLHHPDQLNALGVLTRREIEARILGPSVGSPG
jgi:hypothetical protein